MKLSAARVFVRDLAGALPFYRDILALPLLAGDAAQGYLVFESNGLRLVVELVPANAPADEQVLVGRFTGLSFSVSDIVITHASLAVKGVRFTGEPEPQTWGGWLATFADPAGNELQLVQDPA